MFFFFSHKIKSILALHLQNKPSLDLYIYCKSNLYFRASCSPTHLQEEKKNKNLIFIKNNADPKPKIEIEDFVIKVLVGQNRVDNIS